MAFWRGSIHTFRNVISSFCDWLTKYKSEFRNTLQQNQNDLFLYILKPQLWSQPVIFHSFVAQGQRVE